MRYHHHRRGSHHHRRRRGDHDRRGLRRQERPAAVDAQLDVGVAGAEEDDETTEDKINRLMEAKKLLPNAS